MHVLGMLPLWASGLISFLVLASYGIGGLLLVQKYSRRRHIAFENDLTSYFFGAIALLYGVILGLTTISVWTNHADTEKIVSSEASAVWALFRSADILDDAPRLEIQRQLQRYVEDTVNTDWLAFRRGERSNNNYSRSIENLQRQIALASEGKEHRATYADLRAELHKLSEVRQARLSNAGIALPQSMWVLVLVGSFIILTPAWLFRSDNLPVHALLVGLLAAFLAISVGLIADLDEPLLGKSGIDPTPLTRVRNDMAAHMKAHELGLNPDAEWSRKAPQDGSSRPDL